MHDPTLKMFDLKINRQNMNMLLNHSRNQRKYLVIWLYTIFFFHLHNHEWRLVYLSVTHQWLLRPEGYA